MLDQAVDAGAARAAAEAGTQFVQIARFSRRYNLHVAVFGVAHPSAQFESLASRCTNQRKPTPCTRP